MTKGLSQERVAALKRLEAHLGVVFPSYELLHQALIHKSYANEQGFSGYHNERLEFLGDAVLELVISEHTYRCFPSAPEGELARLRSVVVSEHSLAEKARSLKLGEFLLVSRGEAHAGGRNLDSLLSDALEAVIGAMYLELDYNTCRDFILGLLGADVQDIWQTRDFVDPKSALQEKVQQCSSDTPVYAVYDEQGPDHDKTFRVAVKWRGQVLGRGQGKTKKDAEQDAARSALAYLARKNSKDEER
ncbi:MAG: ribonuclease III [Firmicutes bacterium]|jgi:ribonuclease-3|nr:ribonuclease III [Bacillota bacterium]